MPFITLSTDIGLRDFTVGAIKGQILSAIPNVTLTDISHYLSQTNFPQSAYICKSAITHFPPNTFHLIIVNLFEYEVKQVLLAKYQDQWIICPDNGILTMITQDKPAELYAIDCKGLTTLLSITNRIVDQLALLIRQPSSQPFEKAAKRKALVH